MAYQLCITLVNVNIISEQIPCPPWTDTVPTPLDLFRASALDQLIQNPIGCPLIQVDLQEVTIQNLPSHSPST
jgi:hypothetical protein